MANPLPLPLTDPIATPRDWQKFPMGKNDPQEGICTDTWGRALASMVQSVNQAPNRIVSPILSTAQTTSIAPTLIAPGQTASGLYRIAWYARVTTAAAVASSLTVTITFTDHTQAISFSGAALIGNTVTSAQSESIPLFWSDALTPITYSTAYVSNPAAQMEYQLYVLLESMFQ